MDAPKSEAETIVLTKYLPYFTVTAQKKLLALFGN